MAGVAGEREQHERLLGASLRDRHTQLSELRFSLEQCPGAFFRFEVVLHDIRQSPQVGDSFYGTHCLFLLYDEDVTTGDFRIERHLRTGVRFPLVTGDHPN